MSSLIEGVAVRASQMLEKQQVPWLCKHEIHELQSSEVWFQLLDYVSLKLC